MTSFIATAPVRHGVLAYLRTDTFVGRCIELYGEHSPGEIRIFEKLLKPGDVVVEAGANIGDHTLSLAKIVGPKGVVVAYEPQAVLFGLLLTNMALNGVLGQTVLCERTALCGAHSLRYHADIDYSMPGNYGAVSLDNRAGVMVDSGTLDDRLPITNPIKLLKIDVEGAECDVLDGARGTIERFRPYLYVENDRIGQSAELIQLIMSFGYKLWWHFPLMVEADNYRNNTNLIYSNVVSINMLCVPDDSFSPEAAFDERDASRMTPVTSHTDRPEFERAQRRGA